MFLKDFDILRFFLIKNARSFVFVRQKWNLLECININRLGLWSVGVFPAKEIGRTDGLGALKLGQLTPGRLAIRIWLIAKQIRRRDRLCVSILVTVYRFRRAVWWVWFAEKFFLRFFKLWYFTKWGFFRGFEIFAVIKSWLLRVFESLDFFER